MYHNPKLLLSLYSNIQIHLDYTIWEKNKVDRNKGIKKKCKHGFHPIQTILFSFIQWFDKWGIIFFFLLLNIGVPIDLKKREGLKI